MLIGLLDLIRINFHFLNPFNETIRDYEITDIVYSRLRDKKVKKDDRIVLVNAGFPPSRDTIRMILDRIIDDGAKVIALDITFEERKNFKIDSMLLQSMGRIENVVLANKVSGLEEDGITFKFQEACDTFFANHITTGFINFIDHDSSTIRYFSPREKVEESEEVCMAFAVRTASLYEPAAVERLFKRNKDFEEIYYTGDENQFTLLDFKDILDVNQNHKTTLADKIVLIGFHPTSPTIRPVIDKHYTPLNPLYTGHNSQDMYGMVIHANIILMILDNTYIYEFPFWINLLLTSVFCYFNVHLFYQIFRRVSLPFQFITRFLQLGEIILLFFIVAILFHYYRIKMDMAYWISALLLTFDAVKFYDNGIRKRFKILINIPYTLPPAPKRIKRVETANETPKEPSPDAGTTPAQQSDSK